ncbi:MAG: Lrp/AsnC family transcriptional regulator [Candidatus Aenigmarchaeota archaeon]|nr:Lrp/AsnC family transcriptional regulator [Candidatus Aenigmarchaeota archaeon]
MVKISPLKGRYAKLDLKDKRILYELDVNARASASEIGKMVGLSKQVVNYRINRLKETGVIQKFYTICDLAKFGYTPYKVFLRLQNADMQKYNEIVQYILHHDHVQFFVTCDGMFDLLFNILAKSPSELYEMLKEMENIYGDYIAEKEIIIMVFSSFFFRDYLTGKSSGNNRKPMYFGSKPDKADLDRTDEKILHCLGIDARMPLVDIARKVGTSPDVVKKRIRRMEKSQIIHNYILLPDFNLLNQTSYKVLFRLHNISSERDEAFFQYFKTHPNFWFHSKSLGRWDIETNMDVMDASHFREIMMEIKSSFSDIIKEYNTLQVSRVEKFNFFPFRI